MKRSSRTAESAFADKAGGNPFAWSEIIAKEKATAKPAKKAKKKKTKKGTAK